MKKEWIKTWNSSKLPRKQRKYRYNAPLHILHKFLGCHLSKELRKKYGRRAVALRKDDKVKLMRGSHKGYEAKVDRINLKSSKIYLIGMAVTRKEGSKRSLAVHPSNLMITELNLSDKRRAGMLERKKQQKE